MVRAGAAILDVGGESTRPGAAPLSIDEELSRILPVIRALASEGHCVSVDTRNAATMTAALEAGAAIVNDVTALTHDPASLRLAAARGCAVVLMHMRGTPATMNSLATYGDVVAEVAAELSERIAAALAAGVLPDRIAVDPGLGFAKKPGHSVVLLRELPRFAALGYPVLVGASRKSFIGKLAGVGEPSDREPRLSRGSALGPFVGRGDHSRARRGGDRAGNPGLARPQRRT